MIVPAAVLDTLGTANSGLNAMYGTLKRNALCVPGAQDSLRAVRDSLPARWDDLRHLRHHMRHDSAPIRSRSRAETSPASRAGAPGSCPGAG